jgi:hypothetical protein
MKLLVCGSRTVMNGQFIYGYLDAVHLYSKVSVVIEGAASGADTIAHSWALSRGIDNIRFPADWAAHGKRAGYLRNVEMADQNPDMVIAFFDGDVRSRGTAMMVDIARDRGIVAVDVYVPRLKGHTPE